MNCGGPYLCQGNSICSQYLLGLNSRISHCKDEDIVSRLKEFEKEVLEKHPCNSRSDKTILLGNTATGTDVHYYLCDRLNTFKKAQHQADKDKSNPELSITLEEHGFLGLIYHIFG